MRNDIAAALRKAEFGDTQDTIRASFRFDSSLAVFRGHFPGHPLLPGVFQIEMVRVALEAVIRERYSIAEVNKAKFAGLILPDQDILMEARLTPSGQCTRVRAKLRVEQAVKADISITLKTSTENNL